MVGYFLKCASFSKKVSEAKPFFEGSNDDIELLPEGDLRAGFDADTSTL
jgi:hypothetical protein